MPKFKLNNSKQSTLLGLIGEYLAICIYLCSFYRILYHRKRFYKLEVDLIALIGTTLVFVEVKTRSNNFDNRLISTSQINRIKQAAALFICQNKRYQSLDIRFDLVVIRPWKFPIIIKNAW